MIISPQSVLGVVLNEHPGTISVFLGNQKHCPGCVMARSVTTADAAANYRLHTDQLIDDLCAVLAAPAEARS